MLTLHAAFVGASEVSSASSTSGATEHTVQGASQDREGAGLNAAVSERLLELSPHETAAEDVVDV